MAPFRLGLTTTLDRKMVVKHCYPLPLVQSFIVEKLQYLSGKYLSDYETIRILVDLSEERKGI